MQTVNRLLLLFLVLCAVTSLPVFAQRVIATVPVGTKPQAAAVNPVTNQTYVANYCGNDPSCASTGTVSVIYPNNFALSVNVGFYPVTLAVNSVTNTIYALNNNCYGYPSCAGTGTVTVIDGATNNITATIPVGTDPYGVAVDSVTNKIYVANVCGNDTTCGSLSGTVSVIDGVSNTVTATVMVGANPYVPVVNSVTNKIYVPNACGTDPTCGSPYTGGTVTVIDGATNNPVSVAVGILPDAADVNTATNTIYVANQCGDDPYCASTATVTKIDGATLATTDIPVGGYYPFAIAVNSVTNKIYVPSNCFGDTSCNGDPNGTVSVIDGFHPLLPYYSVPVGFNPSTIAVSSDPRFNQVYVANECGNDPSCQSPNGTVTVIDGATRAFAVVGVGDNPYGLAIDPGTNIAYVPNYLGGTVSVIDGTRPTALQFVALPQPCRAVDTRSSGGPIQGHTSQSFPIQQEGSCNIPASAAAYSMNVTLIPPAGQPVGFLTIWPAGQSQPIVSTMNSYDGRYKANAAIVPAGMGGAVSVYVSDTANVALDVNGYFEPMTGLEFYPLTPCRVADTRWPNGDLGGPYLLAGQERTLPVLESTCGIPGAAQAYSLNFTAIPRGGPLWVFNAWPDGQPQPNTSTLNAPTGTVVANAAIVSAGPTGAIDVWASNDSDLAVDVDGYFAPAGAGGLSLYGVAPCRVIDTRSVGDGLPFNGTLSPPVDVVDAGCATSSLAQAFVFNATVVPAGGPVVVLTLWPDGASQPGVSTLNAYDGVVTSNMAIVPTTNGSIDANASGLTQLILDISSYFAP